MLSFEFFHRFLISRRAGSMVKTISRISIIGIWLGVTAFVLVISVMNGFNRSIRDRLLEVEPHLVLNYSSIKSVDEIYQHPSYGKLKQAGVEIMTPLSYQDVILRTTDGFVQRAVASGVTRDRLFQLLDYANKKSGKDDLELRKKIENLKANEVVMGVGLADSIGVFKDDSMVLIPPETLLLPAGEIPRLSQAVVKGFLMTDIERIDRGHFYYLIEKSFPRLQQSVGRRLALEVWLKNPSLSTQLKKQLNTEQVKVETWEDRNASLFFALKMEKIVVSFLVGLSTLIAGLSIISVMVLLITQKRKDIGNLLAMGMTQRQTQATFINIGMFLAMSGVVIGILSGILMSLLVNNYSDDVLPAFYEETNIPAEINAYQVISVLVIAITFSYLALRFTMRKLSTYKPSEILRS